MEGRAMGQVLHGCATTTEAVRRAIRHSQESLRALARRYGINPKTVAKWRRRSSVTDLPTGPMRGTELRGDGGICAPNRTALADLSRIPRHCESPPTICSPVRGLPTYPK